MSDVKRYKTGGGNLAPYTLDEYAEFSVVLASDYDSLRHELDAAMELLRECRPWLLTPGYSTERDAIVARIDALIKPTTERSGEK